MTRYWLLALLAGSCLAAAAQVPKEAPPALTEKVDRIFRKWDSTVSPGCALAVIKDAQIIYQRGYGMADLDHDVPIRPESVFHVASVSKQFTAAAIVLLAQDGKLSLDDEVRKYVPELPDFGVRMNSPPRLIRPDSTAAQLFTDSPSPSTINRSTCFKPPSPPPMYQRAYTYAMDGPNIATGMMNHVQASHDR